MPAFDYYKPQSEQTAKTAGPQRRASDENVYWQNKLRDAQNAQTGASLTHRGGGSSFGQDRAMAQINEARMGLNRSNSAATTLADGAAQDDLAFAKDRTQALTTGVSDRIMNDPQVAAALGQLESGMRSGPYTPEIQQQIVNRNADQTAAAEAVNADEFRNQAAARGMSASDPAYQAQLRQSQSQRQQQNVAFQGDMGTRAALENYGAQQNAARGLASGRLAQYGQAQPGYAQGAQFWNQTTGGGERSPAVTGGGNTGAFGMQRPVQQQPQGNPFAGFNPQEGGAQAQVPGQVAVPFKPKTNSPHVTPAKPAFSSGGGYAGGSFTMNGVTQNYAAKPAVGPIPRPNTSGLGYSGIRPANPAY